MDTYNAEISGHSETRFPSNVDLNQSTSNSQGRDTGLSVSTGQSRDTSQGRNTAPRPYWSGHVTVCPNCSKRILDRLLTIHLSSCPFPPVVPDPIMPDEMVQFLHVQPTPQSTIQHPILPPAQSHEQPTLHVHGEPDGQVLSSVPDFSLAERATQLKKYEVLLLTVEQVSEFNNISLREIGTSRNLCSNPGWF